jgi:penicillin-binding protein 1A
VFGVFPIGNDPKAPVIWEAFQPQTEPRRSYRSTMGNPYDQEAQAQQRQAQLQQLLAAREAARSQRTPGPAPTPQPQPPQAAVLPTQNSL